MKLSPVTLFIYNRPSHLLRTLISLQNNEESNRTLLIIYADGPKENSTATDIANINAAREVAKSRKWCKDVRIVERSSNFGLSLSIIDGVTKVVEEFGRTIVLEDDLELSPYFLAFMNEALNLYVNEPKVLSIGACNFFATGPEIPETFFIPIPDCLGWATWLDRWRYFEHDGRKLLSQLKENNLMDYFNIGGAYNFQAMLESQIAGVTNSWAIRWQAVSFIRGMLNLYPKFALTNHIGIDSNATNSQGVDYSDKIKFPTNTINVKKRQLVMDDVVKKALFGYYKQNYQTPSRRGFFSRLTKRVKKVFWVALKRH